MFYKFLILALTLTLSVPVMACDSAGESGFVEENDLYIGVNDKGISTITEAQFNAVLDRLEAIYAPIIEAKGKKLKIFRKWKDGTVNAYAKRLGKTWQIHMFGGLARHKLVTADGFALVACHELGHHLAGIPKTSRWSWASNEGQSDYFANTKCFRKYVEADDNTAIVENMEIPAIVTEKCQNRHANGEDMAICMRGSMGGLSLGSLLNELSNGEDNVRFDTPDTTVVSSTNNRHPKAQCRLDTYFQGSLCDKSAYDDFSRTDAAVGACTRGSDYVVGMRPLCWYRP